MYFDTITNVELQHFHERFGADFSMSLTEILTSDLFHAETIITGEIYRVYPLFYCTNISSNNSNDIILDNRCIICTKQTHETYLTFQTIKNNNIILDDSLVNIKDIEDTLTLEEFNDFVYRVRKTTGLTGNLNYKNENQITGSYGKYTFGNLDKQLRTGEGLVINDKLKANPLTVKLTNPFFLDANYTMVFTVITISDANIDIDDATDNITTSTFSINLVEDLEVEIPISTYDNDSIILFDTTVNVDFNTPEIRAVDFDLDLDLSKVWIKYGESVTLTATLSSTDLQVAGYNIQVFENNTLLDTLTTNNDGEVTKTITPTNLGANTYAVKIFGLRKENIVTVDAKTPTLTSTISSDSIGYGGSVTATATLTYDETALEDMDIDVYIDNNLIDTLTTDSNGAVSYTATGLSIGSHTIKFTSKQENPYASATTSKTLTVNKLDTTLSVSSSGSTTYGGTVTFTGTLKQSNNNLNDKTVYVYLDNNLVKTGTTSSGSVSYSVTGLSVGYHTVKMVYNGNEIYNGSNGSRSVSIGSLSSSISISANPSSTTYNGTTTLSGTLSAGSGNVVRIYQNNSYIGYVTTGSGGSYSYTTTGLATGTQNFYAYFGGNGTYSSCSSSTVSVNVSKITSTISLSASSNNINVGQSVTLSGSINAGGGQSVKIYINNNLADTVTTETNGSFSISLTLTSVGDYSFKAVYDGNSLYTGVESSAVTVGVTKKTTSLTLLVDNTNVNYGDNLVLTCGHNLGAGKPVKIYQDNVQIATSSMGISGFRYTVSNLSLGQHTFYVAFDGDSECTSATSQTITVTVKYGTSITLNVDARGGDGVYLDGVLSGVGSATGIKVYAIEQGGTKHLFNTTTDANGAYSKVIYYKHNRMYFKVEYEGDSTHYGASYTTGYYSW